jgi:hypothetical protein
LQFFSGTQGLAGGTFQRKICAHDNEVLRKYCVAQKRTLEREVETLKAASEGRARMQSELVRLVPYLNLHPINISPGCIGRTTVPMLNWVLRRSGECNKV